MLMEIERSGHLIKLPVVGAWVDASELDDITPLEGDDGILSGEVAQARVRVTTKSGQIHFVACPDHDHAVALAAQIAACASDVYR